MNIIGPAQSLTHWTTASTRFKFFLAILDALCDWTGRRMNGPGCNIRERLALDAIRRKSHFMLS
jgi:hypothetical protein